MTKLADQDVGPDRGSHLVSELIREPSLLINGERVPGSGPECEVENPAAEQLTGISAQASMSKV